MSKKNFGWPQEPFDSPGRRIIFGEHVKKSRRLHAMCLLMFLCSATILIGALTLGGTSIGSAASARRVEYAMQSADRSVLVPTSPHTVTNKIAFMYGDDIWLMDPDGSNHANITNDSHIDTQPAWSPDGSKIAFLSSASGTQDLWVMDVDGSNRVNLTNGAESEANPSWSPDGTKIAFDRYVQGPNGSEIFAMNSNGSNPVNLTNSPGSDVAPRWSHDGTKIAYVRSVSNPDPNIQIYVMNADGSNPVNISNNSTRNRSPAWSPDDTKLSFSRFDEVTGWDLYTMNSNGSNPVNLTNSPGSDYLEQTSDWSPDGSKIIYDMTAGSEQIWVINSTGGTPVQITNEPGANQFPRWQPGINPVVEVKDENGDPVKDAEVFQADMSGFGNPVGSQSLGRTNSRGVVSIPDPKVGQLLMAQSVVYTGTTNKGSHGGWAYHVHLTNIEQRNDAFYSGAQITHVITDATMLTQTLTIKRDQAQIGLNLVASTNYNATSFNLGDIVVGLTEASAYLFDITDGQMYIEKITLYDNNQNFADADIQYVPQEVPHADAGAYTWPVGHVYLPGPGWDSVSPWGGWTRPNGYRTIVHELGHYLFNADDEYKIKQTDTVRNTMCTLNRDFRSEDMRASLMDIQYNATEMCSDTDHNPNTAQGLTRGGSVWDSFVSNWEDQQHTPPRWTFRTPMSRGSVNPGPYRLWSCPSTPCPNNATVSIVDSTEPSCERAVKLHAGIEPDPRSINMPGVGVFLNHNGRVIYQGVTNMFGELNLYGAAFGDEVTAQVPATDTVGNTVLFTGRAIINSCSGTTQLTLRPPHAASTPTPGTGPSTTSAAEDPARPDAFSTYWVTGRLNHDSKTVTLSAHFDGAPQSAPSIAVSQDSGPMQSLSLTYDAQTFTYSGSIEYDPERAANFLARLTVDAGEEPIVTVYPLTGTQFDAAGPAVTKGVQKLKVSAAPPPSWTIFPSEGMVSLVVNASSMVNGSGVLVGEANMPGGAPPQGLRAVGGPYFIEGENPITGQVAVTLSFWAEHYCGLQESTISIYRYNGNGTWSAIPTSLVEAWDQASAQISQWGIYAVFAKANPQQTFSDVPPGSTFETYVQWMACHRIASGYPDGTFKVGNNATRGQISKMVSLAYHWSLEPSAGGDHTFADVPVGSTFYLNIETAYKKGIFSGYACGGPGESCDGNNRPYFRPGNNATRGQIAKILSNASGFTDPVTSQTFEDVPPTHTFYEHIGKMASRGIIGGYACGSSGEPCVAPENRPYFRSGANATRGQLSKMIYLAVEPR